MSTSNARREMIMSFVKLHPMLSDDLLTDLAFKQGLYSPKTYFKDARHTIRKYRAIISSEGPTAVK